MILSLARVPQPRIGSFRFHADGTLMLANRPLLCCVPILENGGTPRTMPRDETYTYTEPFISDMLALHDGSFLANRNAVYDEVDCRGQIAARVLLRALSHQYVTRKYRGGPFRLQFTDFHPSNILVDDNWNVTCLIDLERICSLPAEMLAVPYWFRIQDLPFPFPPLSFIFPSSLFFSVAFLFSSLSLSSASLASLRALARSPDDIVIDS